MSDDRNKRGGSGKKMEPPLQTMANEESREEYRRHRRVDFELEVRLANARKEFKRMCKKAKSDDANKKLEEAVKNVYDFKSWAQGRRQYPSPPIANEEEQQPAVQHQDKCDRLINLLLPVPPDENLDNIDLNTPRANVLPLEPVTRAEVQRSIFETNPNKAPGPTGIHLLPVRWAWTVIEDELFTDSKHA